MIWFIKTEIELFLPILRKIKIIICWCGAGSMFQLSSVRIVISPRLSSSPSAASHHATELSPPLSVSLLVSARSSEPPVTSPILSSPSIKILFTIRRGWDLNVSDDLAKSLSKLGIKLADSIIQRNFPFFLRSAEAENKRHFSYISPNPILFLFKLDLRWNNAETPDVRTGWLLIPTKIITNTIFPELLQVLIIKRKE